MQEILTSVALVLLIATHYLLVRKCASLEESIPAKTATLETGITEVRALLDEALDMFSDALPAATAVNAVPSMSESIPAMLLSRLMGGMTMGAEHGPTQQNEWEVLPPDETTTQSEEN